MEKTKDLNKNNRESLSRNKNEPTNQINQATKQK